MSTGHFELIVQPKQSHNASLIVTGAASECKSEVLLRYQPVKELYPIMQRPVSQSDSFERSKSNTSRRNMSSLPEETWNSEQTDEFVRKLGFLEAQKVEQPVKRFQQLNQVRCIYTHNCVKTS